MASRQLAGNELVIMQQPNVHNPSGYAPIQPFVPPTGIQQAGGSYPSGLEYLIGLDKVFIHQKIKPFKFLRGANRYIAIDENEQLIYNVQENAEGWLNRTCMGGTERSFEILFTDTAGRVAIKLERILTMCQSQIDVYNGDNVLLGSVRRLLCSCMTEFRVDDENQLPAYRIVIECALTSSPKFMISTENGVEIGVIQKQWAGFKREFFTDIFGVTFPMDLDVRHKALLLAAAIHIDFSFYER